VTREEKRQQRRARIDARREKYRGKREDLIAKRAANGWPERTSRSWTDYFEPITLAILSFLSIY
jgi:hypothetical protein